MRWEQGREAIERMLADSELQRVPPSRQQADRLPSQARVHVASALKVCDAEYPPTDSPEITSDDVRDDQKTAEGLIDLATRILDEMSPF